MDQPPSEREASMSPPLSFATFFERATGVPPFSYQAQVARTLPAVLRVPTGAGKTATAIVGWLWRRHGGDVALRAATPRRLVYCLPMRVLVEQTFDLAQRWITSLGLDAAVGVHLLLGGDVDLDWDRLPERDAILIGTQDLLLSRALNRGYAMSRYRWPAAFGLLNNDCLWVIDEVQLMGVGLATTTQLAALRRKLGTFGNTRTVWMSATLEPGWLETIDVAPETELAPRFELDPATAATDDQVPALLKKRLTACKRLARAHATMGDARALSQEVLAAHRAGTRTLVVCNTVPRAVALFSELKRAQSAATLVLVHSRFRPPERKAIVDKLLQAPPPAGTIVVATQVIEAGVDLSSATLFTELAPWASLVQRFGRCNRTGEYPEGAAVYWIDAPEPTLTPKLALPYAVDALSHSRELLGSRADVGPAALPTVSLPFVHTHVLRRKDVIELFDTTPDLAGQDVDVSRFIREADDRDVHVFWRAIAPEGAAPENDAPPPRREELCVVPLSDLAVLIKAKGRAWIWDPLDEQWQRLQPNSPLHPGLVVLLAAADGRYVPSEGWQPKAKDPVPLVAQAVVSPAASPEPTSNDGDPLARKPYLVLAAHTERVFREAQALADALGIDGELREALLAGARWHDAGKAHPEFQWTLRGGNTPDPEVPQGLLAKSPSRARHRRKGLRHELASGILALMHGQSDLAAYLAASHHGKVRLSLRSLPIEAKPSEPGRRFARGIWHGERLPAAPEQTIALGGRVVVPATEIDLSYMDLGAGPLGPSWLARMLALRDRADLGPFRLALLEAVIRAADARGSEDLENR